jgi:micrococcal nuclease
MNSTRNILAAALVGLVGILAVIWGGSSATEKQPLGQVASPQEVGRGLSSFDQVREHLGVPKETEGVLYKVIKVVDGDTLTVEKGGKQVTLRLIGLNTPETVDPRKTVECFGAEASKKAKEILNGKLVRLEKDTSQGELDKYKRTLAYVILEDGTNFNKYMIREGYGYEYTYNAPYKYQKEFKQAEALARAEKKGLWADGACAGENKTEVKPTATVVSDGKFICSKNTYNCTSFKSQKEAQEAFDSCGGAENDVHKLDSDKDGVVCESLP